MLELATWASVIVLTVGALLVFGWFLSDLRRVVRRLEQGGKENESINREDRR